MQIVPGNDVPNMERSERRSVRRRRMFKGAVLTFSGVGAFEAVVRNQSEKGAMLALGDTTGVPAAFNLAISGDERKSQAQVRWRSQSAIGVEFV